MASDDSIPRDDHQGDPAPSARRQETRNRLLDAAMEIFTEKGVLGATVENVCSRAGFTRGAFYSNFSSKEELFLALLSREYDRRTIELHERAAEVTPLLQDQAEPLTLADAEHYVSVFLAPTGRESIWFALETEFLLLAIRDTENLTAFADFVSESHTELAALVEDIVRSARRRFTIPVERAIPILGGVYERAFKITAVAGPHAPEGLDELGERIAELLFAITEIDESGESSTS